MQYGLGMDASEQDIIKVHVFYVVFYLKPLINRHLLAYVCFKLLNPVFVFIHSFCL